MLVGMSPRAGVEIDMILDSRHFSMINLVNTTDLVFENVDRRPSLLSDELGERNHPSLQQRSWLKHHRLRCHSRSPSEEISFSAVSNADIRIGGEVRVRR